MKKYLTSFFMICLAVNLFSVISYGQVDLSKGLFAYYPMTGNAKNAQGTGGGDCTVNGATLSTDRFGNANSAYAFDGTSFLEGTLNTTGFTGMSVSAWVKTSLTSRKEVILYAGGNVIYINLFDIGHYTAAMDGTGGNNAGTDESSSTITTGNWMFVTATNDGATTRVYVNGNLEKSYSETLNTSNGKIQIGGAGNPALAFVGNIDEVRIYSRQLSDAEVQALYIIDCPNNIVNGIAAYYPMTGNAKNMLGAAGGDCIVTGAVLTTDRFGNSNAAYSFDGSSYLEGTLNTTGFSGLTAAAWIKTSLTTRKEVVLYAAGNPFYINLSDAGHFSAIMDGNGNNNAATDESSSTVTTGNWIFLAASNDGTTTRVYVNGNLEKSYAEVLNTTNGKMQIGGAGNPSLAFAGSIDEVRIYNRALCDNEILTLYTKTSTGIASANNSTELFNIYPDPAKNSFTINSNSYLTGNSILEMHDLNGRLIFTELIDEQTKTINIANQKAGIYILRIKSPDGIFTKKMVVE
jgi:hypothetical protein